MAEVLLATLNPRFRQGSIRVRVSRMWEYRGGRDDGDLRHIDLVFLDSEGFPMYAEVGPDALGQHQSSMVEGKVYKLTRFRVIEARNFYKAVDSRFMIDITVHTIIEECVDVPVGFPLYTYRLTPFSQLSMLAGENKRFVDIIGMITDVEALQNIQIQGQFGLTPRRTVTLRDTNNYEMKLYLWGQRATEFDADEVCQLGREEPVVAIFVGLLVKTFRGDVCLSGNSAARWYLNVDVPEVHSFLSNLHYDYHPVLAPAPHEVPPAVVEPRPEPQLKTVQEIIATSPYDFPAEGFRCTVTVSRINERASWYFASCNRCNKACFPDGPGYKCGSCDCNGYKFKYKICLFGTDGTAEAEFVFFGDVGRRLVQKEIRTLMRSCSRAGDMPSEIAALVSQKYQLTVNVSGRSFRSATQSYQVKNIDCAYGRQAVIPQIGSSQVMSHQAHAMLDVKGKQHVHVGLLPAPTSSSAGAASKDASPVLIADTAEKSSTQDQDATPPPRSSPVNSPIVPKEIPGDGDKVKKTNMRVRRQLFREDSPAHEGDQDEDSTTLEDAEQSDEDAEDSVDPSDPPLAQLAKKARSSKRLRKS